MFEKKTIINGEKIECDKKEDIEISVCMACYNGEKYILEQLQSILIQLNDNSELIICLLYTSPSPRD